MPDICSPVRELSSTSAVGLVPPRSLLAIGLEQNAKVGPPLQKIHAYDTFVWRSWMEPSVTGTPLEGKYREGDSFLGEFNLRTKPHVGRIVVRQGDLRTLGWEGTNIEFLLVDAMKSWELANCVISQFYPSLLPGRGLVLHQDFAHWYTPWIHLTHYRLRRHFELRYEIPRSSSVIFALREPIPRELTQARYSLDGFQVDEVNAAFEYSCSPVSRAKRPNIIAAKIMCLVHLSNVPQAWRELEQCRSQSMSFDSDLALVEKHLRAETVGNG